jgi:hypothetical protein
MRTCAFAAVAAILLGVAEARRRQTCDVSRRWVVQGEALRVGDAGDLRVLRLSDARPRLRLEALESATAADFVLRSGKRLRAGKLRAVHRKPKVRLRARVADDCTSVTGVVVAGSERRPFVAQASVCGDGIVDPGNGETCDGAQGCSSGACVACQCEPACGGEPAPIDTTFGKDGVATVVVAGEDPRVDHVVTQSTSAVIAVVASGPAERRDATLVRWTADGTEDTSFGDAGRATESGLVVRRLLVLPDDGLVLVGGRVADDGTSLPEVVRLDADGRRVESFGLGGVATIPFTEAWGRLTAVLRRSDGGLAVTGTTAVWDGDGLRHRLLRARLLEDGTLDPGYGVAGVVHGPITAADGVLRADERSVYAGGSGIDVVVRGYDVAGGVDPAFGVAGELRATLQPPSVHVLDARVLAGDVVQVVYLIPGQVLGVGKGTAPIRGCLRVGPGDATLVPCPVEALAVRGDGTLLSGGACVRRANPDGTPDATFAGDGAAAVPGGTCVVDGIPYAPDVSAITVDAAQRTVAAGLRDAACGGAVVVARWLP